VDSTFDADKAAPQWLGLEPGAFTEAADESAGERSEDEPAQGDSRRQQPSPGRLKDAGRQALCPAARAPKIRYSTTQMPKACESPLGPAGRVVAIPSFQ
jgi:hypothetical protein